MSLIFFDEIFFLQPIILDVVTTFTDMIEHPFNGAGTTAETGSYVCDRAKAVLG